MITVIVGLLVVITITLVIIRLASTALILTGMSKESADFQCRSALTGSGFTTSESEMVMNHPVRRRIIMLLMLGGSISIPTAIAALAISLLTTVQSDSWWPVIILVAGLFGLGILANSLWVERHLNSILAWALHRWTKLEVQDYVSLLQLKNGYGVTEMLVDVGDWLDGKTLREAALTNEGVLVLGIQRANGHYLGAPDADDLIIHGDNMILYGKVDRIQELDQRGIDLGDDAHQGACASYLKEKCDAGLSESSTEERTETKVNEVE